MKEIFSCKYPWYTKIINWICFHQQLNWQTKEHLNSYSLYRSPRREQACSSPAQRLLMVWILPVTETSGCVTVMVMSVTCVYCRYSLSRLLRWIHLSLDVMPGYYVYVPCLLTVVLLEGNFIQSVIFSYFTITTQIDVIMYFLVYLYSRNSVMFEF